VTSRSAQPTHPRHILSRFDETHQPTLERDVMQSPPRLLPYNAPIPLYDKNAHKTY